VVGGPNDQTNLRYKNASKRRGFSFRGNYETK
jgi:hypothetical protein